MPKPTSPARKITNTLDATNRGDERQLMTVSQVAALDNTSEKTVRRAIKAGLLPVIRIGPGGKLIRISKAAHRSYRMTSAL